MWAFISGLRRIQQKRHLNLHSFKLHCHYFNAFNLSKFGEMFIRTVSQLRNRKKKLLSYVEVFHKTCATICTKKRYARAELMFCWSKTIRRLHILQNFAQPLFLISPVYYSGPKRNWRQCLCKIFGWQTSCNMVDVQIAICCCRSSRWGPLRA